MSWCSLLQEMGWGAAAGAKGGAPAADPVGSDRVERRGRVGTVRRDLHDQARETVADAGAEATDRIAVHDRVVAVAARDELETL